MQVKQADGFVGVSARLCTCHRKQADGIPALLIRLPPAARSGSCVENAVRVDLVVRCLEAMRDSAPSEQHWPHTLAAKITIYKALEDRAPDGKTQ